VGVITGAGVLAGHITPQRSDPARGAAASVSTTASTTASR
jgi:hypothetical protein